MSNQKGWGKTRLHRDSGRSARVGRAIRRRPSLDELETRTLLSASPVGIDLGDSYLYGGNALKLNRALDQLFVEVSPETTPAELDRWTAPDGILAGSRFQPTATSGRWILDMPVELDHAGLVSLRTEVRALPGVIDAAEAFVLPGTTARVWATREVVVALADGVAPETFFATPQFSSYRPLRGTPNQFIAVANIEAGPATLRLANELDTAVGVLWASPNLYQVDQSFSVNDPLYSQLWHLNNTGQNGGRIGADARVLGAWDLGYTGRGVVIAVLDNAVDFTHPDLASSVFINTGEIAGNGVDDDGNGYVDDVNGWDFWDNDNDPGPSGSAATEPSPNSHGTAVAGVAMAIGNNNLGTAGAAYEARLLPVRIPLGVAAPVSAITEAVYYASGRNASGTGTFRAADVLNHSYGGPVPNDVREAAYVYSSTQGRGGLGALNFAATGNGADVPNYQPTANYPGAYASTIGVGGTTESDVRVTYSDYGPWTDIVASTGGLGWNGVQNIVTTDRPGGAGYDPGDYTGLGQTGFNGTSSASPLAAGVGALVLSANPSLTEAQVRQALRDTADKVGPVPYVNGFNIEYGYGRVNATAAVIRVATRLDFTLPSNLVENTTYNNVAVAQLSFGSNSPGNLTGLAATIDPGDGSAPFAATLVPTANGRVNVIAPTLSYSEGGTYSLSVAVTRDGAALISSTTDLVVGDLPIEVVAVPLELSEGVEFNGIVATFVDTDPDVSLPGDYEALITWGDGTTSPGTVEAGLGGGFVVRGRHTYSGGDFTMSVSVKGSATAPAFTASAPVNVANSLFEAFPLTFNAQEGQPVIEPIARFVDSDPRIQPATYYQAIIDWGDGPYTSTAAPRPIPDATSAPATVRAPMNLALGDFPIADLNVTLTITHARPSDLTVTLIAPDNTRVVLFNRAPGLGENLTNTTFDAQAATSITEGSPPYNASFRPVGDLSGLNGKDLSGLWQLELTDSAAGITGTLQGWSISATQRGEIVAAPGGGFEVHGGHVYQVGNYQATVQVRDGDLSDATIVSTAAVSNAPIFARPGRIAATEGQEYSGIVAFFQDTNSQALASSFVANIDWGDGTTSLGRITPDGGGQFVVTGQHTYLEPSNLKPGGTFPVKVTLVENNAPTEPVEVTAEATVQNAVISGVQSEFSAVEGQAVQAAVARFRDANANADPASYTASIDWGNGETTNGFVQASTEEPGIFEVRGPYSYPTLGSYNVVVSLQDNSGQTYLIGGEGTIANAPVDSKGVILVATEKTATGTVDLGTFRDTNALAPAVEGYTVTIDWGDGSSSRGQVTPLGNREYRVTAAHTFAAPGVYQVRSQVRSADGGTTEVRSGFFVKDLILPVTGALSAASDTGISNNDGVTAASTLTFEGQAEANSVVTVYLQRPGGGLLSYQGSSDSAGRWSVTTTPLDPGAYEVASLVTDTAGRIGSLLTPLYTSSNPLVVDNAGPQIVSNVYDRAARAFRISYADVGGGLDPQTMLNRGAYRLGGRSGGNAMARSVTPVPGDPNSVLVRFGGRSSGTVVLTIDSPSMSDRAGNGLVETYFTTFPATNPPAGSPYVAQFNLNGRGNAFPTPFVPPVQLSAAEQYERFLRRRVLFRR